MLAQHEDIDLDTAIKDAREKDIADKLELLK